VSRALLPSPDPTPLPVLLKREHSDNDSLKQLERIQYEIEILQANSEKNKIELQNTKIDLKRRRLSRNSSK
jgi:hypothetical protein